MVRPSYARIWTRSGRGGQRLFETIENILDFSKIESGTFVLHPAPISLATLLGRSMSELELLGREKGLTVGHLVEIPSESMIMFDQYCLSKALTNLLDNAIKFTDTGSVRARLYRCADGQLSLEVRDTGIGINPEYLLRLFEPFSQQHSGSTRQFQGTGLGLALTKRYLALNQACLEVEIDRGSVFTIRFPIACEIKTDVVCTVR
jgi:signal transduction histidine kinase